MKKIRMGKKTLMVTAAITFMLLFNQVALAAGKTRTTLTTVKPIFSSSFIQYWFAKDWDIARWTQEFQMLQAIGINEIILQNIGDTTGDKRELMYDTSLPGYTPYSTNMIKNALDAAEPLGMKVRMGLAFDDNWWTKRASDFAWLNEEADQNIAIFNELFDKYGKSSTISGWYLPYEFYQLTATTTILSPSVLVISKIIMLHLSNPDTALTKLTILQINNKRPMYVFKTYMGLLISFYTNHYFINILTAPVAHSVSGPG